MRSPARGRCGPGTAVPTTKPACRRDFAHHAAKRSIPSMSASSAWVSTQSSTVTKGEIRAPGLAGGGVDRSRPGAAISSLQVIHPDDEKNLSVSSRAARADQVVPPADVAGLIGIHPATWWDGQGISKPAPHCCAPRSACRRFHLPARSQAGRRRCCRSTGASKRARCRVTTPKRIASFRIHRERAGHCAATKTENPVGWRSDRVCLALAEFGERPADSQIGA